VVAAASDVRAVFFFHRDPVANLSFGMDLDTFLERLRAGDSIPFPAGAIGLRATFLRVENGQEVLFAMTLDHLVSGPDGRLYGGRFFLEPL
jgi:hypothetical protein